MKIVLVSMNFSPEITGVGRYSGEMADGLIARGHEVVVVCAPPYYPSWKVAAGYSASAYRVERPKPGLTVHRCPIWIPQRVGGLTRLLHLASFALASMPVVFKLVGWQPRVVLVVAPGLFCAPAAWMAARLAGAKAWLHIQDFEIDAAFELGLLKQPWLRSLAQRAERVMLRSFDSVSTISNRMLRQLAIKSVPMQKTELLPNWVDASALSVADGSLELRHSLGIDASQIVCLFSGTINRKQGLGVLVEAARLLIVDPRIVIVICGNGEMRAPLETAALGLPNIRFADLMPAAKLSALLNMADIHLLPQLRGVADLVMPSKLGGMLASGRPVIASTMPGTEIACIVAGCGLLTEPENAEGVAQAIATLAGDAGRRRRLGAAGRSYAQSVLDSQRIFDRLNVSLAALERQPESGWLSALGARRQPVLGTSAKSPERTR